MFIYCFTFAGIISDEMVGGDTREGSRGAHIYEHRGKPVAAGPAIMLQRSRGGKCVPSLDRSCRRRRRGVRTTRGIISLRSDYFLSSSLSASPSSEGFSSKSASTTSSFLSPPSEPPSSVAPASFSACSFL